MNLRWLLMLVTACAAAPTDDLETDEAVTIPYDLEPGAFGPLAQQSGGRTNLAPGKTDNAELRRFLPIGRSAQTQRYVVMQLEPSDLPDLADGDVLRAATEIQVTTRCDIGQVAPGCDYNPHVEMQLVLATDRDGTQGVALSDVKSFDCSKDDHHCVKTIDFADATATLHHACDGCFVNLVAWAYHPDARGDGQDVLLLGANEGNFLANHDIEQDRGRIMAVRARGNFSQDDVELRVTPHNVKSGGIDFDSNGDEKRIYSATINHGRTLHAGETYLVWADIEASSTSRVNLSLEMFLTRNRDDHDGGSLDGTNPKAISEHNGTNCSPGNDCHLRKVAAFAVSQDIAGPVYVNIAASTEVPGPGSAKTTVHDSGFVKILRYAQ